MYPSLYQINTRVWRHRFGTDTKLTAIPESYWQELASVGIEYVWLMGVWQTGPNVLDYALEPGLREEYARVLPDWSPKDIIGSPYAIDHYTLHADLGAPEDLQRVKNLLNKNGLKLILDFVPNHFHAESKHIANHPEIFLEVSPPLLQLDKHTYYRPPNLPERVFAHGKDPYFAAWQDTVQVNYAISKAQAFMQDQLLEIAAVCDGVRCDMAMLPLPHVFQKTWESAIGLEAAKAKDFWPAAIQKVKNKYPKFCFIAEVYWDLEWELQQKGFDYTYDKRLRDRLIQLDAKGVQGHLKADLNFQQKSVRFLENHDEDRILSELDTAQALAAAMVTYLTPGMRFFYEGQWEGRRKRLPVQLGRAAPEVSLLPFKHTGTEVSTIPGFEVLDITTVHFYKYLLQILQHPNVQAGQWQLINFTKHPNLICFDWEGEESTIKVLINYQQHKTVLYDLQTEGDWYYFLPKGPQLQLPVSLAPFQWLVLTNNKKEVS